MVKIPPAYQQEIDAIPDYLLDCIGDDWPVSVRDVAEIIQQLRVLCLQDRKAYAKVVEQCNSSRLADTAIGELSEGLTTLVRDIGRKISEEDLINDPLKRTFNNVGWFYLD